MKLFDRYAMCVALAVIGLLAGCDVQSAQRTRTAGNSQPKIELLGLGDCPDTPLMRKNLQAALALLGTGWTFSESDQEKLPQADERRGYPTPTILVNEQDLYGLPVPHAPSMACRLYPGGVPGASEIALKLKAAIAK